MISPCPYRRSGPRFQSTARAGVSSKPGKPQAEPRQRRDGKARHHPEPQPEPEAESVDLEANATDPEAADWAVYDEEAEAYLAAASEDDPWTEEAEKAMRFTLQEAKDECVTHGEGMIVRRHALADAQEAPPTE